MKKFKKLYKTIKYLMCAILGFLLLSATIVISCRLLIKATDFRWCYQGEMTQLEEHDYIVVPGAGINYDQPGTYLEDRLNTALTLYEAGIATRIIVSGGFDETSQLYESDVMKLYLTRKGIPGEHIICDYNGIDTAHTLLYVKSYAGDARVIICTQSLYASRTAFLAKSYDLHATFADSDIKIYTTDVGKTRLRETFAATKAVWNSLIYPTMTGGLDHE